MRVYDNGSLCSFYSVVVTTREVEAFKRAWPGSGMPCAPVTFQFEKRNGDLINITSIDDTLTSRFEGPAAVALSNDAQAYGRLRLKLTDGAA